MAGINDFKILNKKCDKYFDYLKSSFGVSGNLSQVEKRRLGFYIFVLEQVCDDTDIEHIEDSIIDTQFNKVVNETTDDDCGIDAVFINDEDRMIKLFNFKFREKYNDNSSLKLNDTFTSGKFLNIIKTENTSCLSGKPKEKAEEIINRLNSDDEWTLQLYQVSNEFNEETLLNEHVKNFQELYDLEVIPLALPTISELMSIRPKPINASLVLDKDALMCYSEDPKESAKSYIARIRSSEIVRITCNSEQLRNQRNLEDDDVLSDANIDFGVLYDNVRGFVLKSKFNPNIIESLKNEPSKFFMYNNGITIVAKNIEAKSINGDKRMRLTISDFQILNGGQTVRSIHKFNKENSSNISQYLCGSEVLVRIFMPDQEGDEVNKIAEYTNSQNAIKSSDLKSLTSEQIDLERYLDEHEIIYSRKSGDTGDKDKNYKYKITMDKFGQILMALNGYPERSTNSVQNIFGKHYKELFIDNFDISNAPQIVYDYFKVIKEYKKSEYRGVQLKYFYIMYMKKIKNEVGYDKLISLLEKHIKDYVSESNTSDVRKMGQTKFRIELEAIMNK